MLYEVTGSRALTFADAIGEIAAATGRPIHYRRVTADAFAEGSGLTGSTASR